MRDNCWFIEQVARIFAIVSIGSDCAMISSEYLFCKSLSTQGEICFQLEAKLEPRDVAFD
jgi:hypothetical protein